MIYQGGCHCRAVTFEVDAPDVIEAENCNCSVCKKTGFIHLIVPNSKFKLLSGKEALTTYTFNTKVAQHYFCSICGIKPFYIPRSNPDGVDVNINCIDTPIKQLIVSDFDGQNWEQNAHKLAHKSKDT